MSATAWVRDLPSLAAARERAGAQAPRLVAALLLALIAIQLALTLTRQAGQTLPSTTSSDALPRTRPAREVDLGAIVNAHLFGQKPAAGVSASDAPQSSIPLVLAGVYAVGDPQKGMAIIGQTATNARLVQVGGNIAGGARLHSVYGDRVIIDRAGTLEAVYLPKNLANSPPPSVSVAPAAQPPGQRLQAIAQNGTLLNGLLRVQAVTAQGKLLGFRVFPGGRNSLQVFGQLGLRPGDLITHINGTALDDANRSAEILQTLTNSAAASVTVSRNGQPVEVNLNFTAVAQAAEEAVAADAAAAAGGSEAAAAGRPTPGAAAGAPTPAAGTGAPPGGGGRPLRPGPREGNNFRNGG